MNCREARAALWPPERPRLLRSDVEEAEDHVRRCPECIRYFAQDRTFLEISHRLRSTRAPLDVRGRIYGALASAVGKSGEASGAASSPGDPAIPARASAGASGGGSEGRPGRTSRPWLRRAVLSAAALAIVAGASVGGAMLMDRDPQERVAAAHPEEAFVEDYLRRAVGQDFLETSDPDEIARFLHRELGLRSRLLRTPGLVPARVEICLLEGQRGAMVVYHMDGRSITHYLVPGEIGRRPPAVADDRGGLAVVTWSSGGAEEALVGELPATDLLAIARAEALE